MKKQWMIGFFAVSMAVWAWTSPVGAAPGQPVEVSADVIDYDAAQGQVHASGNVIMKQTNATITGSEVHYNMKSMEGLITGGVHAVKDDATLTASEVKTYNNTRMVATGSPILVKGQSKATGSTIEYDSEKQYALIPSEARLESADGVMTANKIEAFYQEDRAVGEGAVHLVSESRQVDATGDHLDYYGLQTAGKGRAVLTGNARALQEGNLITGDTLTIHMDSQTADAKGRTKLVITPKE
ncbi:MAG: LptA/OstA family protein [Sporomusaceae bacterium]|nr:LptA/OstA family protein [Sporomusaceae bacterium]